MHSTFFEPAGTDSFVATPATAGPWSAHSQHGGPPSALAARALELHEPDEGQRLARVAARRTAAKTFRQWAEKFIVSRADGWTNPKHRKDWENSLARYAYPVIGDLPMPAITD